MQRCLRRSMGSRLQCDRPTGRVGSEINSGSKRHASLATEISILRTNYILIDLENVQPDAVELLGLEPFKVIVFVGANQAKLPFELAACLQRLGARAEYVKIAGNGPNALDFHIAFYVGQLAAADPSAFFHIVSKDAGFDPLIAHLKTRKILSERVKAIADIPLVKASAAKSPHDRVDVVVARLKQFKAAKPRTIKTLSSTIASVFLKAIAEDEVQAIIRSLADRKLLSISGTKVTYSLPGDA